MTLDALLFAYIDLNILMAACALLWAGAVWVCRGRSVGRAYGAQLRLLNRITLVLLLSPLFGLLLASLGDARPPGFTDMLVRQYLRGHVTSLSADQVEQLIGLREALVRDLSRAGSGLTTALLALAGAGVLCSLWRLGRAVLALRQIIRSATRWKRICGVEILVSSDVAVALSTRGLWRRYVILPLDTFTNPRDLRLTVAHELQHFRQGDIESALVLELLRPVLFWNPAYYHWRSAVLGAREFACDQALERRPGFDPRAYCECLIRATAQARKQALLQGGQRAGLNLVDQGPTAALLDRRDIRKTPMLTRRILAVTDPTPKTRLHQPVWSVINLCFLLAIAGLVVLIQRAPDWSHDRIMLSTIVNLERLSHRPDVPDRPDRPNSAHNANTATPVGGFGGF